MKDSIVWFKGNSLTALVDNVFCGYWFSFIIGVFRILQILTLSLTPGRTWWTWIEVRNLLRVWQVPCGIFTQTTWPWTNTT